MAKLINAKCPNCGAVLELPETLERAFCMHCGGKVIISRSEGAIPCPKCNGWRMRLFTENNKEKYKN